MLKFFFVLVSIFTISRAGNINIDKLLGEAKKSHKHVLIFLHKPHCSYCENMIEFTLPDSKILQKIKKDFIFVDIDIADSGEVIFDDFKGNKHKFAKYLRFDFYPSSVFIDEDAEVVYGQAGYKNEDKYLKTLRFVHSRAYVDMGIDDFK
jgi:thioredoxin-related protein